MTQDDATTIIVDLLRGGTNIAHYGYEVYVPNVIYLHLRSENPNRPQHEFDQGRDELSPWFYAAAWELCRQGILRPGVRRAGTQATEDGSPLFAGSLVRGSESGLSRRSSAIVREPS